MRFPRACRACVGGDIRVQDRCISFMSCFHAPVTEEDSWIVAWSPLQPAVHDAEGRASKDEKIDRVAARPRGKNFPRDWRLLLSSALLKTGSSTEILLQVRAKT